METVSKALWIGATAGVLSMTGVTDMVTKALSGLIPSGMYGYSGALMTAGVVAVSSIAFDEIIDPYVKKKMNW